MTIDAITTLPEAPDRNDSPGDFTTKADSLVAALVSFVSEMNTSISQMNLEFTGTYYDGAWSAATGSKTAPKIYSHNGAIWLLLNNVADITAETPFLSNSNYLIIGNNNTGESVLQTLSGTTPTWTMSDGAAAQLTLSGNSTITLAGEPSGSVCFFAFLRIKQDGSGSGYTLAFSGATVTTEDGLGLPAMSGGANDIDDYVLYTLDNGTTYVIRRITRNPG